MAIDTPKKHMISALFIFNIYSILAIYSQRKKGWCEPGGAVTICRRNRAKYICVRIPDSGTHPDVGQLQA